MAELEQKSSSAGRTARWKAFLTWVWVWISAWTSNKWIAERFSALRHWCLYTFAAIGKRNKTIELWSWAFAQDKSRRPLVLQLHIGTIASVWRASESKICFWDWRGGRHRLNRLGWMSSFYQKTYWNTHNLSVKATEWCKMRSRGYIADLAEAFFFYVTQLWIRSFSKLLYAYLYV